MSEQIRRYEASERPKGVWRARFEGTGEFPYDMLRYDSCWPAHTEDAVTMARRQRLPGKTRHDQGREVRRQVTVLSHFAFETRRWESFGWREVN